MTVKGLCDLTFEVILSLTIRYAKLLVENQVVWNWIYDVWCYMSCLPTLTQTIFYDKLNACLHTLSHESVQSLSADEALQVMVACQNPRLIFNYRLKRQRLTAFNAITLLERNILLEKYLNSRLTELDFSGADFGCNDYLLISLLPLCKSLTILSLGNAGSKEVLNAAKYCPLTKLEVEERFPLHPKLPQSILLSYILGFEGGSTVLDEYLDLLKTIIFKTEDGEEKELCAKFLESFHSKCTPTWPKLTCLLFGNCRLCREAAFLCILVLKDLQEISIHRIQSDEILNTCDRIFNAVGVRYEASLRRLKLSCKWAGFKNETLDIAPETNDVTFLAHGYSRLDLQKIIETNSKLRNLKKLAIVGIKSVNHEELPIIMSQLQYLKFLELSGAILNTEELVHILSCFPKIVSLKLHYSEVRNHTYALPEKMSSMNHCLREFSIQTSYIEYEWLKSMFAMAPIISKLCIRGKTRNFRLSTIHQQLFLNYDSSINDLELYPINKYNLDVVGLISLASSLKNDVKQRYKLKIPIASISDQTYSALSNSGWMIFPICSRCS